MSLVRLGWHATLLAVLCAGGTSAALAMDLAQAYQLARQNDPTFDAARQTLAAVEQRVPQARAGLLPTLNVTGAGNQTQAQTTFTGTPTVDRTVQAWNWALQLTQPLYRAQNYYAYDSALAQLDQAQFSYRQAEQDLILRLAEAYFAVLTAEESMAASQAEVRAMQEQWQQAKRGFETGVAAITDMHDARSKLEAARSQQVAAENEREVKMADLERLLGDAPKTLAKLGPSAVLPRPEPSNVQTWVSSARDNNPVVQAQVAAMAASEAEVKRNRAEHYPTLDFNASTGANRSSGSLTTPTDYSTDARSNQVGVQLTVPLFAGGATSAKVAEAQANRAKAAAQLEDARRQAAAQAKQAYAAITNGLAQVEALQAAIEAGEQAVKGNRAGYQLGIRINSDVLLAEQQLFANRRDLAKARHELLLQGLKLKAAAGSLSEQDVAALNEMLDK
jgi:outer membrane protein